jgi:hypothetical protein
MSFLGFMGVAANSINLVNPDKPERAENGNFFGDRVLVVWLLFVFKSSLCS